MVEIYHLIFKANPSSSRQSDIIPIKMNNNIPFKDAVPRAGSVQPIAGECNQFLFKTAYSLQLIISFERGSNCAEHVIKLSNMCLFFTLSQRYSTQFTAERRVVFKMNDLLQKTCSRYSSLFRKFQLGVHRQNVLFPCKCVTVFNRAALLGQNVKVQIQSQLKYLSKKCTFNLGMFFL